ncbi:hypothetical protein RHSIM_Rhsim06G0092400 [Rhododendron simsii]|uniref:Uncharacterized protein n=1 Tax=Rhododendron simsii TaxID=118357 RepID=A0A834LM20_RHOSS|nr:hypothetical protein RHSIM_Rhsim06G0092400 [Rhododendron simsii]
MGKIIKWKACWCWRTIFEKQDSGIWYKQVSPARVCCGGKDRLILLRVVAEVKGGGLTYTPHHFFSAERAVGLIDVGDEAGRGMVQKIMVCAVRV